MRRFHACRLKPLSGALRQIVARSNGLTISPMDILIAQVCIHHAIPLCTLDVHVMHVPDLQAIFPDAGITQCPPA